MDIRVTVPYELSLRPIHDLQFHGMSDMAKNFENHNLDSVFLFIQRFLSLSKFGCDSLHPDSITTLGN